VDTGKLHALSQRGMTPILVQASTSRVPFALASRRVDPAIGITCSGRIGTVKEHAVALDLPDLVWSAGAPEPVVLSSESRTVFLFDVSDQAETGAGERRLAEFVGCTSLRFGFPNDEALGGHPLYGNGLEFYRAHEVVGSTWLAELRRIESTHPQAFATPFPDARHYLLAFHDSILEAVATGVRVIATYASDAEALDAAVREISGQ